MTQLRNIFVFFAALFLAACNSRNVKVVEGVLVVDVEEVREGKDIAIEELAETVEVIQLETAEGAFFEFRGATMSENYIVVRAANGLVRIFGCDGRFVGLLEDVDERTAVYDITIHEGRGRIYVSTICGDRLLAFDLAGHRLPDIKMPSRTSKAVLTADSCGVALAQFDFTDTPSGFNAAIIKQDSTRHTSRPSLCIPAHNSEGFTVGYNNEIFGSCTGGQLYFMTTFCDTLFRYNSKYNRIVPELAVNITGQHGTNTKEDLQDTIKTESWLKITALPCHYIINIAGTNAQEIIVDKARMTATRANIVSEISQEIYFADGYAYAVLPPDGKENATLIRWKLSEKLNHKPAPNPDIPKAKGTAIVCDEMAVTAAIELFFQNQPEAAMAILDSTIAKTGVKCGHPALANAYAVKSVLYVQMAQPDSAYHYRHLVNAPLTNILQCAVNQWMMEIYAEQGDAENAQRYAIAYGTTRDVAPGGSQNHVTQTENHDRINTLSQQVDKDSRQRFYLLSTLVLVIAASCAAFFCLRRQKRRQIAATRRELQTLMEKRIETMTADKNRTQENCDELRSEMIKNHAFIRRIANPSVITPLSSEEETLLHSLTQILYPGFSDRLQSKAITRLGRREQTICFLIRLGVTQHSICVLLDVKPSSFRVAKSNLKRDRFRLPVESKLEDFICGI